VPGRGAPRAGWRMPRFLWGGAWVVMGLAYTLSGVDKLSSAAWREGSALGYIAGLPYAREGPLHDLFVALPEAFSTALTTSALAVELLFAPLALSRRLRPWIWLAAVGLHGGILLLMDFWELTMGVLLMHAFTFDARWLPASWRHLVMEEA